MMIKRIIFFMAIAYAEMSCGQKEYKSEEPPLMLSKIQDEFARLVEKFLPSVVNIEVAWDEVAHDSFGDNDFLQDFLEGFLFRDKDSSGKKRGFRGGGPKIPQKQRVASQGSGFIIGSKPSKEGKQKTIYVVTNKHVIEGALKRNSSSVCRPGSKVKVRLQSGISYEAEILGSDLMCDIAVLAFKSEESHPELTWGDSGAVKQGHFALAAGNPFGLGGTVTVGRISYKNREFGSDNGDNTEGPDLFLQSDAAMNKGNSGGPLLNIYGEVIGVNTAIFSPTGTYAGISFSVPSARAKIVVDQIIEKGFVHRGIIGVFLHPKEVYGTEHMKKGMRGVLIKEVAPGSSADKKGVRAGDVILSVNDTPVKHWIQVRSIIGFIKPGQSVKLTILRGKNQLNIDVPVESFSSDTLQKTNQFMGVSFGTNSGKVVIQQIEEDSLWRSTLIEEDEILRLGDQDVKDPKIFVSQLNQLQEKGIKRIILTLKRKGKEISLVLPLDHGGEYESS
ncbi:putative periplasmic serine endoprotease [Holospora undulata HU1]|uniref:Putative periplasmic serine endoprotease n=2 Tax=Holospora TaxID=44747 RepID=A0A061JI52_9PROT|nr:putative periplasmic serine endoprotease [Holospora undulata HU1]